MQQTQFYMWNVGRFETLLRVCLMSLTCLIISGCCLLIIKNAAAESNEPTKARSVILKTPTKVEVKEVQSRESQRELYYCGTLEESESIPLCFSVLGTVSKVFVSEGEKVKAGQLLATLDNANYKNLHDIAAAKEKQAEDAYSRLKKMYMSGSLPEIKMIEVETSLQEARSAAAISLKNLKSCALYATADGLIGRKSIESGTGITSSITAITIIKTDKLYTRISVPENEISLIEKGQKASIVIPALGLMTNENERQGVVEEIGAVADPLAHAYKVKIILSNDDGKIRPGMVARVTISRSANIMASRIKSLLVPNDAVIMDENGKPFLFVADVSSMRAVKKYVNTGTLHKDGIEIFQGLEDGNRVIVSGQHKLEHFSLIEIVN